MQRKYVLVGVAIVVIVVVSAVAAILAFTPRSAPAVIRVEPDSVGRLTVGDTFTVNVTVENCVDVFAVQVDLRYDPTVLNATKIVEGSLLPSFSSTIPIINWASNFTDTLPRSVGVYFADSLTYLGNGTRPRADGSGVLLTITFEVVGQGSTELQLFPFTNSNSSFGTYLLTVVNSKTYQNILPELSNGSYGDTS